MAHSDANAGGYQRYHIQTQQTPNIDRWPCRFKVKVGKVGLAKHLITDLIRTRFDMEIVTSRPCMYGVYSGPVGGFAPREHLCVGCLRCTVEYPGFVEILPNPERQALGDSYFTYRQVETVAYEAETGRIPVKGAGYRGYFGGEGWDGMWTDMSEIVRPTRDGIHGREFISTVVDIGTKPDFLTFDQHGKPTDNLPYSLSIPIPFLFDVLASNVSPSDLYPILARTAQEVQSLAVVPIDLILGGNLCGSHLVPLASPADAGHLSLLPFQPRMVEMNGWDADLFQKIRARWPEALVCLRIPFITGADLLRYAEAGVGVFHLTADYHGRGADGAFVFDLIRAAHQTFVDAGRRDEVTLLGSGGIAAAEHVPKAIIAGLDAVALDTPLLVALQGRFGGEFTGRNGATCRLPETMFQDWAVQRLKNLVAAWRDQLLEVLGAMGLREVRRLRGEMGRAMFQKDLEREAFTGIEGYDD
jgi:hypothetical protein